MINNMLLAALVFALHHPFFFCIRAEVVNSELALLSERVITTPSTIPDKVPDENNLYSNEELGNLQCCFTARKSASAVKNCHCKKYVRTF